MFYLKKQLFCLKKQCFFIEDISNFRTFCYFIGKISEYNAFCYFKIRRVSWELKENYSIWFATRYVLRITRTGETTMIDTHVVAELNKPVLKSPLDL